MAATGRAKVVVQGLASGIVDLAQDFEQSDRKMNGGCIGVVSDLPWAGCWARLEDSETAAARWPRLGLGVPGEVQ